MFNKTYRIENYVVLHRSQVILLWEKDNDEQFFIVPFSIFKPSGDGTKPNFHNVSIVDGGHTLRLGRYEACADVLLDGYEFGVTNDKLPKR